MKKIMLFCVLALATCLVLTSCSGGGGGGGIATLFGQSIAGTTWETKDDSGKVVVSIVFDKETCYMKYGDVKDDPIVYSYTPSLKEIQFGKDGVLGKVKINTSGLKKSFDYLGKTWDKK